MFLGWDPNKHMNMTEILVPHDKLWIPDTTLYNSYGYSREKTRVQAGDGRQAHETTAECQAGQPRKGEGRPGRAALPGHLQTVL